MRGSDNGASFGHLGASLKEGQGILGQLLLPFGIGVLVLSAYLLSRFLAFF